MIDQDHSREDQVSPTVELPLKYKDLISQSEGENQQEELELNVQISKSKLEVDISQTNLDLANAKQALAKTKRAIPYDVSKEIKAYEKVKSLEGGLEYAKKVLEERF